MRIDKNGKIIPNHQESADSLDYNNELTQELENYSKSIEKYVTGDEYNRLPASLKATYNPERFYNDIIHGDIERLCIPESDNLVNPANYVQSSFEWIVKATGFIAEHLNRWIEEQLTPELKFWYRPSHSKPFTERLIAINKACEDLLNVLPARLPNFPQRFIEKHKELKRVASEADSRSTCDLENGIHNFKLASETFHKTILAIHSEALLYVETKAKQAGEEKSAETEQGNKAINKPENKTRKIFGDKFEVFGLPIDYKNLLYKIKNWPCVAKRIKAIKNLIECKLKKTEK